MTDYISRADAIDVLQRFAEDEKPTDDMSAQFQKYQYGRHLAFLQAVEEIKALPSTNATVAKIQIDDIDKAQTSSQLLDDLAVDMVKAMEKRIVEVVRCKDCRWYENRYGEVCHNPRYGDGHANYSPPYVDEEYWCKDGERRKDE